MMKRNRIPALLVCAVLLLSGTAPAGAAPGHAGEESAQALWALGLFQGTAAGRFDAESMALDRVAGRAEAVVMLIRLLGQEEGALAAGYPHPFSDVPRWADPYVGYAYQQGLTGGVGEGRFGTDSPIRLDAYVTLLLRALGYQEGADFTFQNAVEKGLELGLCDADLAEGGAVGMTRGELALVSWAALRQRVVGTEATLAGSLAGQGLLDGAAAQALGIPLEAGGAPGAEAPVPEPDPGEDIQAVVDLVNEARAEEGLAPLVLDEGLTACAMIRAEEIGRVFDHNRPDGRVCFTVLEENGVAYTSAGENIASGFHTPAAVVRAWMDSPGHRANIMKDGFGRIGVGVSGGGWVQIFAD